MSDRTLRSKSKLKAAPGNGSGPKRLKINVKSNGQDQDEDEEGQEPDAVPIVIAAENSKKPHSRLRDTKTGNTGQAKGSSTKQWVAADAEEPGPSQGTKRKAPEEQEEEEEEGFKQIVGRVVFSEDSSRTLYYLAEWHNGSTAWHEAKGSQLDAKDRVPFIAAIPSFDEEYPRNERKPGKIPKAKLDAASVRPPFGYLSFTLAEEDTGESVRHFGHSGFKSTQAEAEAKTNIDSTIPGFVGPSLAGSRGKRRKITEPSQSADADAAKNGQKGTKAVPRKPIKKSGASPPDSDELAEETALIDRGGFDTPFPNEFGEEGYTITGYKYLDPPIRKDAEGSEGALEGRLAGLQALDLTRRSRARIIMRCARAPVIDGSKILDPSRARVAPMRTYDEAPVNTQFEEGDDSIVWCNNSLQEMGGMLYLIGWAETSLGAPGIRRDFRQFVQSRDILRHVTEAQWNTFENKPEVIASGHGKPVFTKKDMDLAKTFRDKAQTDHIRDVNGKVLSRINYGSLKLDDEGNIVRVHYETDKQTPLLPEDLLHLWQNWQTRERWRIEALQLEAKIKRVDEEFARANPHLGRAANLPTARRIDPVTKLSLVAYKRPDLEGQKYQGRIEDESKEDDHGVEEERQANMTIRPSEACH